MTRRDDGAAQNDGRADAIEKVAGSAKYVSDIKVPGMVHGKILRSPIPHGTIVSIDTSGASKIPGVVAVLTGRDLDGLVPLSGVFLRDRPLIAIDKVRYVGEPVVAIAAEHEAAAEEALDAVNVEYSALPFVTEIDEALAPGAPRLHDDFNQTQDVSYGLGVHPIPGTNVFHHYSYQHGDPDAAMAVAERVFEDTFTFPMVYHYAMEPHCAIASCTPDDLTIWSATQLPFMLQKNLAEIFRLPLAKVRVIVPYVGGGFGSKGTMKIEALVAALAWKARRPVRVCLSVHESMLTACRLAARCTIRTGLYADGTILAKSVQFKLNGGAYADLGPAIAHKAANRSIGPYRIPNLKLESEALYTNTAPGSAFRSIGGPQAVWATESQMDIIAAALGIDPLDLRYRNLLEKGEHVRPDLRPLDVDMAEGLRVATKVMKPPDDDADEDSKAWGLAMAATDPAARLVSSALVRLKADGSVLVLTGSVEMGQGVSAVLARIVAEELAVPVTAITLAPPDTAVTPFDSGTGASRSTVVMGLAVKEAAADVRRRMGDMAAEAFGMSAADVHLVDGDGVTDGRQSCTLRALFHRAFGMEAGEIIGLGSITPRSYGGKLVLQPPFWETAIGACTIAVDPETGRIRVTRYVSVVDVGRVWNPKGAEGQDEGAAVQGLGHALFEELRYEDGMPINASLIDYRVPTIEDAPDEMHTVLIESGDGPGPGGARGMGEGGILPIAPAIANALARAYGVRVRELPLTPERVWRALRARREAS